MSGGRLGGEGNGRAALQAVQNGEPRMFSGSNAGMRGFCTGISTLVLKRSREAHRIAKCNGNLL